MLQIVAGPGSGDGMRVGAIMYSSPHHFIRLTVRLTSADRSRYPAILGPDMFWIKLSSEWHLLEVGKV